ncbi:hypothetical protein C9374_012824 [Naegleria lovaniensis]|uniref:Rho GTPase activating protein n=1 Tax=Naegleria lovaniensis TaxID=51637 RepID=A0AA88GCG9_NAELO|nr:uncharacterized protein C9374_012824 [Naegleria lovaniensis]KAG2373092.1 hypothetical protein C9374_012824 [Naegleria lovaniensis]
MTSPGRSASTMNKTSPGNSYSSSSTSSTSNHTTSVPINANLSNILLANESSSTSTTATTSTAMNRNVSDSVDQLVDEITLSPKKKTEVGLHLLLNKLANKEANAASSSGTLDPATARGMSIMKISTSSPVLFGGLLENHFPNGTSISVGSIPPVLEKMLSYLKQDRIQRTPGIFRLTGSLAEKERFIQMLNEAQSKGGDLSPVVFPNSIDPNIVCNLLVEYFNKLDRALFEPFHRFVEINEMTSDSERVTALKKVIDEMHPIYRNVIRDFFYFLVQILLYKEENRLSVKSLSVVLGPALLRGKLKDDDEATKILDNNNNSKKNAPVNATTLISTRQLSQKMVDFYVHTVGQVIESYHSVFDEDELADLHKLHHKKPKKADPSNPNKTLDAFIQKLQEHKQRAGSTMTNVKRHGESTTFSASDGFSGSTPREPKKPTTKNDEEWENIQKSWMQFVESWKKKYSDEKQAHEDTAEAVKITKQEIEFEKKQMKEELNKMRDQLDEKKRFILQKRSEWELQKEQLQLNWENEKIDLEKEKSLRSKEIQESREQFKQTLEYYNVKNFQIDSIMGDEEDDEISKTATKGEHSGDATSESTTSPATNRSGASRSVIGGQKISVDSRFKKKLSDASASDKHKKKHDDDEDSDSDDASDDDTTTTNTTTTTTSTTTRKSNALFTDLEDKTPQSSLGNASPSKNIFLPKDKTSHSSSEEDNDDPAHTKRCAACKKKITGEYMETSDGYYHKPCFSCCNCSKEITGPFATVAGKFWCATCIQNKNKHVKYQTKDENAEKKPTKPTAAASGELECSACKEKILNKADMVKALGKCFHKQCFLCQRCGNEFENMKFYDLMGDPVCANCKRKSIKSKVTK